MDHAPPLTESALFHGHWDDGLLDLVAGGALLGIGLAWPTGLWMVVPALAIPLWGPLRARFVEPHAGYVEFSRTRQATTRQRLWGLVALGVAAFALVAGLALGGGADGELLRWIAPAIPALIVSVPAALAALLTGAQRFFGYAAALVGAGLATAALAGGPAIPLAAVGALAVLVGAARMRRFLRDARAWEERH